jgi:Fe-S-cluster containining protein
VEHNSAKINPACDACKGACCSTFTLPAPMGDHEALAWIELRGRRDGRVIRFDLPCRHLEGGMCGIQETKPLACRVYPVGGPECLAAIRAQRPQQAAQLVKLARDNREG